MPTFVKRQQPAPKDLATNSSHNKFLKDAPIEADMLMRKQGQQNLLEHLQSKGKDVLHKSRPKTSDNSRAGYDHQKGNDVGGKLKNLNQNTSKEIKSSHDKYEKGTRSHMNQVPNSQMSESSQFVPTSDQRNQML